MRYYLIENKNITCNMIGKITGYSGFRTYGELPYPTRKQGKQLEQANKVWQSTVRPTDKIDPLENYHTNKTVYRKSYLQNTFPQHYYPNNVQKGTMRTTNFENNATGKAYDKQQAQKYSNSKNMEDVDDPRKARLLQTGTQHWQTVYKQTVGNPQHRGLTLTSNNFNNNTNKANANGNETGQKNKYNNNNNIANGAGNQMSQIGSRSHSLGGKTKAQQLEQQARNNSYKCKPYINNAKTGITDYKFNYGVEIGDSPMDLMNMVSVKQPLRDHPLKRGTNQLWTEIPNYQGFKPVQLPFKQYEHKIGNRNNVDKGHLKLQTAENFHIQTPGYGGFKPQFQKTSSQLRESILSTKAWKIDS